MKSRIVIQPKRAFDEWLRVSNIFAKSLIAPNEALKQFNGLDAVQRVKIKRAFDKCDKIRSKKIPIGDKLAWELSVMVDAHIIATEFNIDPLTAVMCMSPACKANERVFFK